MTGRDVAAAGAMAGLIVVYWIFGIAYYIYFALCLQTIAKKLGAKDTWMAWVPILNIYLMVTLAERPAWWIILFFIPGVNIVMSLIVWAKICEKRGRPSWWTILFIIPIANFIVPALLAWSEATIPASTPPPPSAPPPPPPPTAS